MKISATVSGGFAGLEEAYHVDTEKGPTMAMRALEAAIEKIGFFDAPANLQEEFIGADAMGWTITIIDRSRQHSVSFVEDGSPEIVIWRELIEQIKTLQ
jgi:hypothetical protein